MYKSAWRNFKKVGKRDSETEIWGNSSGYRITARWERANQAWVFALRNGQKLVWDDWYYIPVTQVEFAFCFGRQYGIYLGRND